MTGANGETPAVGADHHGSFGRPIDDATSTSRLPTHGELAGGEGRSGPASGRRGCGSGDPLHPTTSGCLPSPEVRPPLVWLPIDLGYVLVDGALRDPVRGPRGRPSARWWVRPRPLVVMNAAWVGDRLLIGPRAHPERRAARRHLRSVCRHVDGHRLWAARGRGRVVVGDPSARHPGSHGPGPPSSASSGDARVDATVGRCSARRRTGQGRTRRIDGLDRILVHSMHVRGGRSRPLVDGALWSGPRWSTAMVDAPRGVAE